MAMNAHTAANARRYARVAPLYDCLDSVLERRYRPGRELIGAAAAEITLEIGAGTGKNFPFYSPRARVFALDLSDAMLRRARRRLQPAVRALLQAQASALPFRDASLDTVAASFVCCVQDDPRPALTEIARVLKPGGRALLLEYVVPNRPLMRAAMRALWPWLHALYGVHWEHDVPCLLAACGLRVAETRSIWGDVVRYIVAQKPGQPAGSPWPGPCRATGSWHNPPNDAIREHP